MRFSIDAEDKFVLIARQGGWDLVVDDKIVHYCQTPVEAVKYMAEELREAEVADGVAQVVDALARVEAQIEKAVEVVKLNEAATIMAPILRDLMIIRGNGSRREHVRAASLLMAGCTEQEFRVRDDRREIVIKVRTILEPFFQVLEIQ